jgi:hypothetical protein
MVKKDKKKKGWHCDKILVHLKEFGPTKAHWHGDVDLEVVPKWDFFCILYPIKMF